MTEMVLLAFALVSFIGIATPGPTVLLALTNGSRFGVRRAVVGMVGAVLSDFVLIGAVALGLGALLAASEFWFSVVKWIGVGYLAFLGIMLLRSRGTLNETLHGTIEAGAASVRSIFLKSFLVAVTNPKGYLFFSAFLPQFVVPASPQIPQYVALALVFATIDFMVMFGYAMLGSQAVRILKELGRTLARPHLRRRPPGTCRLARILSTRNCLKERMPIILFGESSRTVELRRKRRGHIVWPSRGKSDGAADPLRYTGPYPIQRVATPGGWLDCGGCCHGLSS